MKGSTFQPSLGIPPRLFAFAFAFALLAPSLAWADSAILFVGGHRGTPDEATLTHLEQRLGELDPAQTVVVFTGDYLSNGEFPKEADESRQRAETELQTYIETVLSFSKRGGRVFFLPGEQDFNAGRGAVRRLRRYLNDEFESLLGNGQSIDVMPVSDCGDPHLVEITNVVAVALLNSPWWLLDWESHPRTNQGCDVKSRAKFSDAINSLTKGYRTRRLLIASHHPIDSYGRFGGNFSTSDHLSLPLVGTLMIWARQSGLVPGYRNHVMLDSLLTMMHEHAQTFGSFVFASGHDPNLQALKIDEQLQLISGHSGTAPEWVTRPAEGEFARSAAGWVEVRLDESGEGSAFVVEGRSGKEVYERTLAAIPKLAKDNLPPPAAFPDGPVRSKYTKREVAPSSVLWSWLVGDFYRDAYALDLEFDPLNIDNFRGGKLDPISIGGGSQTNSIRFVEPNGAQWAARATTKDSTRYLPYPLNRVPTLRYFLEEGFTGIHPSAATTVPPLASALGLLHTEPRLFYLPDQVGLGEFRGFISDEVVLLEQRPKEPKSGELPRHLGGGLSVHAPVKYVSTTRTLKNVQRHPWKHHIAQDEWLRARLLDILLGDWDRHHDQWKFAQLQQDDGTYLYRPIPRDRDQACAHYDGLFLFLARFALPEIRRLRPFEDEIGGLTWLTYNARPIDSLFMNSLTREAWMTIAREVQAAWSDEVIARGMASWPKGAYALHGAEVERKLRARRDRILEAAERFYDQVNGAIEVMGSEDGDLISIAYDDEALTLRISPLGNNDSSLPFFERTFSQGETKELRIFALGGEDILEVSGIPNAIEVRFLGGTDKDVVRSEGADVSAQTISVYDRVDGLKIDESISLSDERSGDPYRNQYDFDDPHHEPTRFGSLASLQFNADDGVLVAWSGDLTLSGFKRRPYASSHDLSAAIATTTAGAKVAYAADFPRSLASLSQELVIDGTTPLYTRNFFGFTSRFIDPEPGERDFYRVRRASARARYGIVKKLLRDTLRVGVRGLGEFIDVEATGGRFVLESSDVTPESLSSRVFAGGQLFLEYETIDNPVYPKRGAFAQVAATLRTDVTTGTRSNIGSSTRVSAAAGTFIPFGRSQRVVLATRLKYQQIFGHYPFYFAPTLGDRDLRAFNDEQLSGNGVFSQTTDLRVELLRFDSGLPGAVGLVGSIDHGFAFGSDVAFEDYNWIFGGSVFWNILDIVGVTISYYGALDGGTRLTMGIGRLFPTQGLNL